MIVSEEKQREGQLRICQPNCRTLPPNSQDDGFYKCAFNRLFRFGFLSTQIHEMPSGDTPLYICAMVSLHFASDAVQCWRVRVCNLCGFCGGNEAEHRRRRNRRTRNTTNFTQIDYRTELFALLCGGTHTQCLNLAMCIRTPLGICVCPSNIQDKHTNKIATEGQPTRSRTSAHLFRPK